MASTQNTLIVIGDNTITTSIKPAYVRKFQQFERATGISMEEALSRSAELFFSFEAPVYMADAKQRRRQKV